MTANQPVTHAQLAAVLTAGLNQSDPKDPNTVVGRMLTTICAMTGVILDDLLAAVDLARATAPAGGDPLTRALHPTVYHPYRKPTLGLGDGCTEVTAPGWRCALDSSAPVHQPPTVIQAPDNATPADLAGLRLIAEALACVDSFADPGLYEGRGAAMRRLADRAADYRKVTP